MATKPKFVKFKKQLDAFREHKVEMRKDAGLRVADKLLEPRQVIRIRNRCLICGRPRAVYRKFGVCRICFRNMALDGKIPGVKKASW